MLDVELPKDVLAKGAHGLSAELIAMLDEELKQAQEQQRAVYAAEKEAKASAAAAHAGVAPDWKPPDTPDAPGGYRADGDLSMYSEEMLHRRKRLQEHPGVIQAIQAWWAWLPKDRVEVPVEDEDEDEDEERDDKGSTSDQQGAARSGKHGPTNRQAAGVSPDRVSLQSMSPVSTPTKSVAATSHAGDWESTVGTRTKVVEGIVKPVYCATVVVLQLVLLPRYGLDPDPHYDPTEDWVEDSKGSPNGPLTYEQFFQAMFQLADQWVDGVVGWDYAKLLADLLQDVQMHERDNLLLSRVMQRYGYEPYYPEWMAQGPQFVPARALPEQKDEEAEAAWERRLDEEEQGRYEDTMYAEEDEEEEEEEEQESGEDEHMPKKKRKAKKAKAKVKAPDVKPRRSPAPSAAVQPPRPAAVARVVAFGGTRSPSPASEPASGRSSPSMWTPARKAKILIAAGFSHAFNLISKLLSAEHKPTPVSAVHLAAVLGGPADKPEDSGGGRRLTGLRSLRIRFGHANKPAEPKSPHVPCRPSKGSLYRVPPAPQVRYRSPPGTRRQRPVPMLPLVPADMYYILPRYWTYSDQLPDKVPRPRPATAPDPLEEAAAAAAPGTTAKQSEPVGAAASNQSRGQSHAWTASLQQPNPAAGLYTHVSPPWHHQPPSLATTQLELVIPPRRRGAGAGPGPVSSPLSQSAHRWERSADCTQSLRRSLQDDDSPLRSTGRVMRASSQSLLGASNTPRLGLGLASLGARQSGTADDASERVSPTNTLAPVVESSLAASGAATGPDRSACPSILSSSLQLPPGLSVPPSTACTGDGQSLGHCQADAVARRLMWLRVGRSSDRPATTTLPAMAGPRPGMGSQRARSTASSPQKAMPPLRTVQVQPTPDSARSRDVMAGLPFSAQGDQFAPWSPPARSAATTPGSPGATSRPRHGSTSEGWRVWNEPAAACQFVQRVSPGLPRFYYHRTVPTPGSTPQQAVSHGTVR